MDSAAWKKLFESIRSEDQPSLVLSCAGGVDVAVAQISRIEEDVVMIRGRLSGSAEQNRLFIIPLTRLNCVYVNRSVRTEEIELYSPTISIERKNEVAKMIAALLERERRETQQMENSRKTGGNPQTGVSADLVKQLETLRESAGFAGSQPIPQQVHNPNTEFAKTIPGQSAPAAQAPATQAGTLPNRVSFPNRPQTQFPPK